MGLELKGDYFNGQFTGVNFLQNDEAITKFCPGDLTNKLWDAKVDYNNIDKVIESSNEGYKSWRKLSFEKRIEFLKKYQEVATKRKDDIAMAIALETGKPLWESATEAGAVAAKVNVTINDSLQRIKTKTLENVLPGLNGHIVKKPLGPTLVIGPFNFPCHLANGQILSALLAGNSIIFKPSEKTIYSSQLLIECFHEAGFPKGVINFINGTVHTTQSILKHPSIKGIHFTGSLAVGKKILESVGTDLTKLVALELGGKNATILHKDTNIDHALPELLRACFLSTGQRCTSTSAIFIHEDIKDEFIDKFKTLAQRIIVDHPTSYKTEPFMGPLIDKASKEQLINYCELAKNNHAQEIMPLVTPQTEYDGHYVSPVIHYLDKVSKDNPFTQEEIFGPACYFAPFKDFDEAIDMANISDYGLAASLFTQDHSLYKKAVMELDAGIINLNRSTVGASSKLPFGGVKNSGNFRPAAVTVIDHTVSTVASLETMDQSSSLDGVKGLK